jgi:uncharacterized cupredoxin-like copper-binding protein
VAHEAFVGDEAAQDMHEGDMSNDAMGGHGTEMAAVRVQPGKSGSLTYTFDKPGDVLIGCHQPGHYAAGMKVMVNMS